MYVDVGEAPVLPPLECPVVWNPPEWGSGPVSREQLHGTALESAALAMIVAIKPMGRIPFHVDDPARENGLDRTRLRRYHVVLATNERCWSFHDGSWQQLQTGRLYTMDPTKEHASLNFGDTERRHLIVDLPIEQTPGVVIGGSEER